MHCGKDYRESISFSVANIYIIDYNHVESCPRMYTFLYDMDSFFPLLHRDESVLVQSSFRIPVVVIFLYETCKWVKLSFRQKSLSC